MPAQRPHAVSSCAIAPAVADPADVVTLDLADRLLRSCVQELARLAGGPGRRTDWGDPGVSDIAARGDDRCIVVSTGTWHRVASGAAGARALPTRTAELFGLEPTDLDRSRAARSRVVDLASARRRARRWRRIRRGLAADLARTESRVALRISVLRQPGDDGTPLSQLPPYAVAARVQDALHHGPDWGPVAAAWMIGSADEQAAAASLLGRYLDVLVELTDGLRDAVDAGSPATLPALLAAARGA